MGAIQQALLGYGGGVAPVSNGLLNNLFGYYELDGNANDETGTYNGTPTNITWDSSIKVLGESASFNGSSSKIDLPTMTIGGTWTYNFRIRFSGTATNKVFLFALNSGSLQSAFGRDNGQNRMEYYHWDGSTTTKIQLPSGSYNDNVWRMFTFTKTGASVEVFVNGVSVASSSSMHNISITSWNQSSLGNIRWLNIQYYNGRLDEFGIWTRVLSGTDITELYNAGAGLPYSSFTS